MTDLTNMYFTIHVRTTVPTCICDASMFDVCMYFTCMHFVTCVFWSPHIRVRYSIHIDVQHTISFHLRVVSEQRRTLDGRRQHS